jgi:hypothetical protein
MTNDFEIVSYIGAKPLLFGMTEGQVEQLFGRPRNLTVNLLGEKNAQYEYFSIRYSPTDNKLVEISFSKTAKLMFNGLDIFGDPKAFQTLLSEDANPYECVGFIILLDLGIALTGFHDDDESQLAVTVFTRGKWDRLKEKFRKFQKNLG